MRARSRFLLDLVIACGLIAAYRPSWTGISLHEWVSIAIIVPLAVHLVVNWEWCVRIAKTFVKRLFHTSRANFVVDASLLVASVAVMLSGVMVSPIPSWFGFQPSQFLVWARLHAWSANAIIALFAVHAALHWRWIVATAKRLASASPAGALAGAGAGGQTSARLAGSASAPGASSAPSRRSTRLAAERAAARRNAGVLGVFTVTVALGSLIFASVAVAGPALSRTFGQQSTAVASVAATTAGHAAAARTASTPPAAPSATKPASAKSPVAPSAPAKAPAAPAKSAPAALTCPRTGCAAATCHGTNGVSASVWYKTHQ
jgi:hypothetical protein